MTPNVYYPTGDPLWGTLDTGAFAWALLDSGYTPDTTVDVVLADVSAFEPVDGSYGRQSLTGGLIVPDLGNDWTTYDADDVTFPTLAGADALAWALLFEDTGSDATATLLAALRIARVTDGTDVDVILPSAGIMRRRHATPLVLL